MRKKGVVGMSYFGGINLILYLKSAYQIRRRAKTVHWQHKFWSPFAQVYRFFKIIFTKYEPVSNF